MLLSHVLAQEEGYSVYYEFKDAKAVEEKQAQDQLHEEAAKFATLTAE